MSEYVVYKINGKNFLVTKQDRDLLEWDQVLYGQVWIKYGPKNTAIRIDPNLTLYCQKGTLGQD